MTDIKIDLFRSEDFSLTACKNHLANKMHCDVTKRWPSRWATVSFRRMTVRDSRRSKVNWPRNNGHSRAGGNSLEAHGHPPPVRVDDRRERAPPTLRLFRQCGREGRGRPAHLDLRLDNRHWSRRYAPGLRCKTTMAMPTTTGETLIFDPQSGPMFNRWLLMSVEESRCIELCTRSQPWGPRGEK